MALLCKKGKKVIFYLSAAMLVNSFVIPFWKKKKKWDIHLLNDLLTSWMNPDTSDTLWMYNRYEFTPTGLIH